MGLFLVVLYTCAAPRFFLLRFRCEWCASVWVEMFDDFGWRDDVLRLGGVEVEEGELEVDIDNL